MINENIELQKNYCGGSLFDVKSPLQPSSLLKIKVLPGICQGISQNLKCA